jgi:hypothetical protein
MIVLHVINGQLQTCLDDCLEGTFGGTAHMAFTPRLSTGTRPGDEGRTWTAAPTLAKAHAHHQFTRVET